MTDKHGNEIEKVGPESLMVNQYNVAFVERTLYSLQCDKCDEEVTAEFETEQECLESAVRLGWTLTNDRYFIGPKCEVIQ